MSISSADEKDRSRSAPKRVSFTDVSDEVHEIPHLDDMPDEEVDAVWYNSEEYSEIKSSYQITIMMMEGGETLDDSNHTSRGLEYRTQEGAWARYENKRDAYNAVLDEQDYQWKVDKDDEHKIRKIYLQHSKKCSDAAVVRGLQDENAAKLIHKEKTEAEIAEGRARLQKKKLARRKKVASEKEKSSKGKTSRSSSSEKKVRPRSTSPDKLSKQTSEGKLKGKSTSKTKSTASRSSSAVLGERSSVLLRGDSERISFV